MADPLLEAFEHAGHAREHLTGLQNYAADLEDPDLSQLLRQAFTTNSRMLERIVQLRKEIDRAEAHDFDGHSAPLPQGG